MSRTASRSSELQPIIVAQSFCDVESSWPKRVAPAVGLFFLAPLVSEFLLGDLPITMLGALVILAPLYGGGALLIREVARRRGLGWPGIFVLALAYAVIEEAFTTQTLFNPNYLHLNLHLLEPAYIPALGIGAWWTIFVLTLHTVWSVSTSIALVEAMVPERSQTPWLKAPGLAITAVLLTLAAIASTRFEIKQDHFIASRAQFVSAALVCIVLIVIGLLLKQRPFTPAPGWTARRHRARRFALLTTATTHTQETQWAPASTRGISRQCITRCVRVTRHSARARQAPITSTTPTERMRSLPAPELSTTLS